MKHFKKQKENAKAKQNKYVNWGMEEVRNILSVREKEKRND